MLHRRRTRAGKPSISSILSLLGLAWRAHPTAVAGIFALTLFQGAGPLATAWITKLLFDYLVEALRSGGGQQFLALVLPLILAQVAISVGNAVTMAATGFLNAELGRNLSVRIQSAVYRKISSFNGISHFETPGLYNKITLGTSGAQYGAIDSVSTLASAGRNVAVLLSFLIVLVSFSPILAAAVSLAALPQLYIELSGGRERFDLASRNAQDERRAEYYGILLSMVQYAKEIRLFGLAEHLLEGYTKLSQRIHKGQRRQAFREFRRHGFLSSLSALVAGGGFLYVVEEAIRGGLGLGDVSLYVSALGHVQVSLSSLVLGITQLRQHLRFVGHYQDLIAMADPMGTTGSRAVAPRLTKGIELSNVWFRYGNGGPWILRGIDLFLPSDRCVALVGRNGAGKSTIVKLLTRLYDPTAGRILWDGIDIREFDPRELRKRFAVILQDFVRYELTVQENIGFGDVKMLDETARIESAARKAGIHDMIKGLGHQYRTIVSTWLADDEGGLEFSGGEWQKIALARMYFREGQFLILDEPTADLDPEAEHEIFSQFLAEPTGQGRLLISHRFSTVRAADIIAVVEDGRIAESGSHSDLYAKGSTYARLFNMQARAYRK